MILLDRRARILDESARFGEPVIGRGKRSLNLTRFTKHKGRSLSLSIYYFSNHRVVTG